MKLLIFSEALEFVFTFFSSVKFRGSFCLFTQLCVCINSGIFLEDSTGLHNQALKWCNTTHGKVLFKEDVGNSDRYGLSMASRRLVYAMFSAVLKASTHQYCALRAQNLVERMH